MPEETTTLPLPALAAHGLSPRAVEAWGARGVERLTPLQSVAVAEYGVLQGRSAIVLAPTSAGKTLIAELAALRQIEARRRVIYLVPTKALAEERGVEFAARFGAVGARVAVSTRERPDTDARVMRGDWDVLVAIYEKMRSFLVARPALLAEVGLVVADELQLLGELGRGDAVELILTKMRRAPYASAQFLGLSAVLGDAERLGAWLGCEVLTWKGRPVELREGVLCAEDGVFRYHEINAGRDGAERILGDEGSTICACDDAEESLFRAVGEVVAHRGESALVFAPTKRMTREWAAALSERLGLGPAEEALARLQAAEPSRGREALAAALRGGVAFHNADLPCLLRKAVERAYDAGEIRALVATSTLAQGVNLSGRNVFVWPHQVDTDRWTGAPVAVALSRARFSNAGGRAGRLGRESEFGRAILIAQQRDEAERLWKRCIAQPPEALRPGLEGVDLGPIILDLVASGVARRPGQVEEFLLATYTGIARWCRDQPESWEERWLAPLEGLEEAHLTLRDAEGDLSATGLGHEVARAGIQLKTAHLATRWLERVEGDPDSLEVLWCACRTADGAEFPLPLTREERRSRALMTQMAEALPEPSHPMSRRWLQPEGGVGPEDLAAAKRALLLAAWLSDSPTEEIEARFGIHSGTIEHLAEHIAWLVESFANMATALGHPDARTEVWRRLARRLPQGLPERGAGWAGLGRLGLGRSHVRSLLDEGFENPADVRGLSAEDLARVIPAPLAQALSTNCVQEDAPDREDPRPPVARPRPDSSPPNATAVPAVDVETGTIRWLGRETRLPPKPARLLGLLAERSPLAVGYREIEDAVWGEGEAAERQQISAHMRRVVRALAEIDPDRAASLIEVRPGQGLRLRG